MTDPPAGRQPRRRGRWPWSWHVVVLGLGFAAGVVSARTGCGKYRCYSEGLPWGESILWGLPFALFAWALFRLVDRLVVGRVRQ